MSLCSEVTCRRVLDNAVSLEAFYRCSHAIPGYDFYNERHFCSVACKSLWEAFPRHFAPVEIGWNDLPLDFRSRVGR